MPQGTLLRLVRTIPDLPENLPAPDALAFGRCVPDAYSPWFCVACGHPHHGMTRHHRLPKRVAWKIPASIWKEALKGDQRIVPMCGPCHHHVENSRKAPCAEAICALHAKLTWIQLREEIRIFDQIAYERTEALIQRCKVEEA